MPSLPRLYAILDINTLTARGLDPRVVLDVWLSAGITLIQLRAKSLDTTDVIELADEMAIVCRKAGALFIVNDRVDIALLAGADGVHVGQDDLSPEQVRDIEDEDRDASDPTPGLIVGLSTHTIEQVRVGVAGPADYLAFGPVFSTVSKADADAVVGLTRLDEATDAAGDVPVVAIGGITLANAPQVFDAGAASVAVISDLLVGDLTERARAFVSICR